MWACKQVGVLRWESDSLKEALEKAKAEKDTYLQMVEEARGAHQDASQVGRQAQMRQAGCRPSRLDECRAMEGDECVVWGMYAAGVAGADG